MVLTIPKYDLEKIKYGVDEDTFQKAIILYEGGKVTEFKDNGYTFISTVLGSQPYRVSVSTQKYDSGMCECYLGQNNTLCKHMVATAIYGILRGKKIKTGDKIQITKPSASGNIGQLTNNELKNIKKEITYAISFIKYYSGPSKTWFAYQNSLTEGVNRLSTLISKLPISVQTTDLIIELLLRLDKKLQSGVDDSEGTVGGFIEEVIDVLIEFAKIDPECKKEFRNLKGRKTCFGWEEKLIKLLEISV